MQKKKEEDVDLEEKNFAEVSRGEGTSWRISHRTYTDISVRYN